MWLDLHDRHLLQGNWTYNFLLNVTDVTRHDAWFETCAIWQLLSCSSITHLKTLEMYLKCVYEDLWVDMDFPSVTWDFAVLLPEKRVNIVWFCRTFNDDVFYVQCQRFKNNFWLWLFIVEEVNINWRCIMGHKICSKRGNPGNIQVTPREPWLDLTRLEIIVGMRFASKEFKNISK